jgi:hypothetical protein
MIPQTAMVLPVVIRGITDPIRNTKIFNSIDFHTAIKHRHGGADAATPTGLLGFVSSDSLRRRGNTAGPSRSRRFPPALHPAYPVHAVTGSGRGFENAPIRLRMTPERTY